MVTSKVEIRQIFENQLSYQWEIRNTTAIERKEKIKRLADEVELRTDAIIKAIIEDVKKPMFEVYTAEIAATKKSIKKVLNELEQWMEPVYVPANNPANRAQIKYEPKGVCCIFGAWNYPFYLVIHPLVEAIAAGNCCMVKASDITPAISKVIAEIVEAVFEPCEVAVIHGDIETANQMLELPFNHIFFTGSTAVGKIVMAAAAKNLSTVTLELGGKSPAILDDTTDISRAAMRVAWGKIMNSGQTCIAPDYVYIKEDNVEQFVESFRKKIDSVYKDERGQFNNVDRAQIVNAKNYNRIKDIYQDAINKGADVLFGGNFNDEELLITPTIVINVTKEMRIMQEELFAPILPIFIYEDPQEILNSLQQASEKPLAIYIFSEDKNFVELMVNNTVSGGVCVNDVMGHIGEDALPFGGINSSGIGSYHGIFGFKEFSHERAVLYSSPNPMEGFVMPPYRGKLEQMLKMGKA